MRIKDILLLQEAPKYATVAWAKPINDSVLLNIYNKGEWHPINGSGNGGSDSSSSDSCWDVEIWVKTHKKIAANVVRGKSDNNVQAILKKGDFNNIMQGLLDGVPFSARVINVTANGTLTELPFMSINPSDSTPVIYITLEDGPTIHWNSDNTLTLSSGGGPK